MIVLHSVWTEGQLHFWAESARGASQFAEPVDDTDPASDDASYDPSQAIESDEPEGESDAEGEAPVAVEIKIEKELSAHPFSVRSSELLEILAPFLKTEAAEGQVELQLPAQGELALPSVRLAHASGLSLTARGADRLGLFGVETVVVDAAEAPFVLERIEEHASNTTGEDGLLIGRAVDYLSLVGRFARRLMAQQRFVPALRQSASGELDGSWQAWFADEQSAEDAAILVSAMPPAVRAVVDGREHDPSGIFDDMVTGMVDAGCRRALIADDLPEVLDGRDVSDPSVSWLTGLLGAEHGVSPADRRALIKDVRSWIGRLEERGSSTEWRLCLRLNEPIMLEQVDEEADEMRPQIIEPADAVWSLSFHLQPIGAEEVLVDAADIWLLSSESVTIEGRRIDSPQELLLAELGRASRLYKPLERALDLSEPVDVELTTNEAYEFLREFRPLLREQGFGVMEPGWFGSTTSRLGAKLLLDAPPMEDPLGPEGAPTVAGAAQLGLDALVGYQWQIAVGDVTLTLKEFEELAERKTPLVQINGKWVEIRPEDVEAAIKFIRENPGGEMSVGEAIRMAFGADARTSGLHVTGLETSGWLADVFGGSAAGEALPILNQPTTFQGTLRPYQLRGYSWLSFLERFGFGACLADDMGLGKTIQLLAILSGEREEAEAKGARDQVLPTLLVVPTSVVGNWVRETERFCPHLDAVVHHGPARLTGNAFLARAHKADLVITTYALANRDQDILSAMQWGRLVLDEAQFIKNPAAKQAQAVRQINAKSRMALTGTPVENRLSELWSIMDFLNPGYLGSPGTFRKKFAVPIEKYRDDAKSLQLRSLVRPFVLRRLKSDPKVVGDLPPKVESREYCHLTTEQAELYEQTVKRMLTEVDATEGIKRRGIVLSALVKLKQICNHPAQALKEHVKGSTTPPSAARSGKTTRLIEMLDEIMAAGDQALIFSQFRQMGHILATTLRHTLDREVLFLHGGTPRLQRQKLVDEFQKGDQSAPIMLVSLRAGGVGLNLTAANHVFHFDRWWNPAVENQATDRAYRIGQTRTVQVHKFVCRGTLEERIDEMLETKSQLAEQIVGSGEQWLTELDTDALRDLLTLRGDAVGED